MARASIKLFPFLFQPNSGAPIAAEWGQLFVPENRQKNDSHIITIPFVRFRCTSKIPKPPIIFLQGGPGESVLSDLQTCWSRPMWCPPLDIADFIFIEQRGFGLSHPCLTCPDMYSLPLDKPGTYEGYVNAHRKYLMEAVSFWKKQGTDLSGYNVHEMAADINDLRQELDYKKISLFGGSFGSQHAFALLHEYGSVIERAFLFGVEGPHHTLKLPNNIQKQLERLDSLLKKDATLNKHIPDLLKLMTFVLDRLEQDPVSIETVNPQTKEKVTILLGKYDLQLVTAKGLGTTQFLKELPMRYLTMAQGDYSWLASQTIKERMGLKSNLMYEATDCASGATAKRRKQVKEESKTTLLGNTINEPFHELCDLIGDYNTNNQPHNVLTSNIPILMASGSLDARTPISNAEELLVNFPNGQLLTIEGVSHDLSIQGDHVEALANYRDQFLSGEPLVNVKLKSSFSFQTNKNIV